MLVNQRTHNLYIFVTVTFTLVHWKGTKSPATKSPKKVPNKCSMDNLTVYETSESPIWRANHLCVPCNVNNLWLLWFSL